RGDGRVVRWHRGGGDLAVDVDLRADSTVVFPLLYYDVYRVTAAGRGRLQTFSSRGLLAARVPSGATALHVTHGLTPAGRLGVAVRVGWVVLAARRAVMGDPVAYTYHGAQLARGQGYRSFIAAYTTLTPPEHSGSFPPTAFYPIGYPAALAVVFWFVFHTPLPDNLPRAVGFFQVALGVGSVLLAAEVARHLFSSRVAVYTAGLVAVFPSLVYYTAEAHL